MRKYRLNIVLVLIIIANIVNMIFPKGMGYAVQTGFMYELSKYIYGLCIVIMFPSLFSFKKFYFEKMRWMTVMVIVYIIVAIVFSMKFEMGQYLKTIMICLSFVFFEEECSETHINKRFIYAYLISVFINIAYLTLTQNRLEQAVMNEGHVVGGQGIAISMVFLLPLIFYLFKGKLSIYLFTIGLLAVIVSLRRTAILAYLLCLPFIYKRMKGTISRKYIIMMIVGVAIIAFYIYNNYWFVIQDRFADVVEANENGYYGSGRTGWWEVLINNYINSPLHWIPGFGLGRVAMDMETAGFPFGGAHNDYLEIGYTYGLIGLYLWFGSIMDLLKMHSKRNLKKHSALIMMASISYLFIAFVSGATDQPHFMSIALFSALILKEDKIKYKKNLYDKLLVHYSSSQLARFIKSLS